MQKFVLETDKNYQLFFYGPDLSTESAINKYIYDGKYFFFHRKYLSVTYLCRKLYPHEYVKKKYCNTMHNCVQLYIILLLSILFEK